MENFQKKTFTTSRSFTYTYYFHPGSDPKKPTLLMCHGWPDEAYMWNSIVPALVPLGFTIVVPDMLGYAGTSKPTNPADYNSKGLAQDLIEILDSEKLGSIIPVGHDWGSFMAQRVCLWHPERVVGLFILNVAYSPPRPEPFDLEATYKMSEEKLGYVNLAYWDVFSTAEGAKLLNAHVPSVYSAMHAAPPDSMMKIFCTRGGMKDWLENDRTAPLRPYAQDEGFKKHFIDRMTRDGFDGPQCWYRAVVGNVHYGVERELPPERLTLKFPVLYLGCDQDIVAITKAIYPVQPLLPDLTIKEIHSGHWCTYENPQGVIDSVVPWLKEKFA